MIVVWMMCRGRYILEIFLEEIKWNKMDRLDKEAGEKTFLSLCIYVEGLVR